MNYRPEVDGLRTIAVFSVIIYHAKLVLSDGIMLPGGYLGVDIFFVISGYLITTLLMKELAQTQRISILGFYERRVRRLLPALILIILDAIPLAWGRMLPIHVLDFYKSTFFSVFFNSNFY